MSYNLLAPASTARQSILQDLKSDKQNQDSEYDAKPGTVGDPTQTANLTTRALDVIWAWVVQPIILLDVLWKQKQAMLRQDVEFVRYGLCVELVERRRRRIIKGRAVAAAAAR